MADSDLVEAVLGSLQQPLHVAAMRKYDQRGGRRCEDEQGHLFRGGGEPPGKGNDRQRGKDRRQPDVPAENDHQQPQADHREHGSGQQGARCTDERRCTFSAPETEIDGIYVAEDGGETAGCSSNGRVGPGEPKRNLRQQSGSHHPLADIDQDHAERKDQALGSERVGSPRVSATHGANIDTAEQADDQRSRN